jgi:hypothetical protein
MNKPSFFLIFLLILTVQFSLFAGGRREAPVKNNVSARLGYSVANDTESLATVSLGIGYESALGSYFSLGTYAGFSNNLNTGTRYDFVINPRLYITALERFFIGANLGYSRFKKSSNFTYGVNMGDKFVFGSKSGGFSLEPSVSYDLKAKRFSFGIALGGAWGGRAAPREARAAPTVPTPTTPTAQSRIQEGIYVGIITFGPEAEDISGGPIFLDSAGLARLNSLLDSKYRAENTIGTALFYAAHLGLANMKTAESMLPSDLKSATMITFTDGLDVSSTGLSLPDITDPGNFSGLQFAGENLRRYQDFVKREIDNRTINGARIDAYVVAVKGDDVTNITAFENALGSLASGPSYQRQESNMRALNVMFRDIANDIVDAWTRNSFILETPEYPRGTRIRMTFGGENSAQQAENAAQYVEGEIAIRNGQYYLTNIMYGGEISADPADQIRGEIYGGRVIYEFANFSGYNFNQSQAVRTRELRQWYMYAEETEWQISSEYRPGNESERSVERHNALVYLILDKSSSIASNDVPQVRDAAKSFIRMLYDAYNQD